MVAKLSSERTMRPAFLATSVPLPMAIPMSAALMAGASLTPSPVMATTSPFFLSVSASSTLCSGATRPTPPIPSIRAPRRGGLFAGWIDHADQAGHLQVGDITEQVAVRVEPGRVEIPGRGGHD